MADSEARDVTRRGLKSLIRRNFLAEKLLDEADNSEEPEVLAARLIQDGSLSEVQYAAALAEEAQTDVVFADPEGIDREVLADYSLELLRRHHAVPLCRDDDEVVVAFDQVPDSQALAELEGHGGARIRPVLTTRSRVFHILYPEGAPPLIDAEAASVEGPPAWLRILLAQAWQANARALRIDAGRRELSVRQQLEDGWRQVETLPIERLEELGQAGRRFISFALDPKDPDSVVCELDQIDGDPRGPSLRITFRNWGRVPSLKDFDLDATLTTAVQCSLVQDCGLLVACAADPRVADRMARALAIAGGAGRTLAQVGDGSPAMPSSTRCLPDLESAARAAEVLVVPAAQLRELPAAVDAASRRLVVVGLADSQARSALLGLLEAGCRPSLVAAHLIVVLRADSTPPYAVEILRLGNEERAAIAADERARLARLLWEV